jgi:hypothetical protein
LLSVLEESLAIFVLASRWRFFLCEKTDTGRPKKVLKQSSNAGNDLNRIPDKVQRVGSEIFLKEWNNKPTLTFTRDLLRVTERSQGRPLVYLGRRM